VGSYRFDGVTFRVYSDDHAPAHVHARYQGIAAILELGQDRIVRFANRWDALRPMDAKRNHLSHILQVANGHFDDLMELWEESHG
jgi:hypothetical protein